jgi:hypothetical protein
LYTPLRRPLHPRSMKILFSASSFGFLRNFQSTIRLLAERGHQIHLIAERTDAIDGAKMVEALRADHPSIEAEFVPSSRHRLWYALGTGIRAALDYWRYLDPRWDRSPKLRQRAADQAPAFAKLLAQMPIVGTQSGLLLLRRLFHGVDGMLPPPDEVAEIFRRIQPDLLLLTPVLYFRSHQVDHIRCARHLGIKTILGVGSWDHLTTKGLIHEVPDRVLVWNEAQKEEARVLHDVPADRVAVTGAQAYDHWFATRPSVDRQPFCGRVGLDPQRPFLLYLCSSPFIAPKEVGFVRRWIAAIRGHADPQLSTVGVLVRPHPQNWRQWEGIDLSQEFENVAFWPKTGVNPVGGSAREEYFDSMYHSVAVIGVNTSAMIESAIVGRPVFTVQSEEFADTQEGTLHFQHLKNVEGGLLHLAPNLDEHLAHLSRLFSEGSDRETARGFVRAFLRPHGLEVAATPRVVETIEELVAAPTLQPYSPSVWTRLARAALVPIAVAATVATMERAKLRSIVLHSTRPARLAFRALVSRLIYVARFFRRVPGRLVRLAVLVIRRVIVLPARWVVHQSKMRVHAFLVWRKGEPDQVP